MRLGPNPFFTAYQRMQLRFTLKAPGDLRVKVYDVRGQLVLTLFDGPVDATMFVRWAGADENGVDLASGVYFVEAQMGPDLLVRKFALVR
ncbi:MAG: T9SS type A sorting domain-containing protein, partial [Candidatus Krumholzibacteria bacterium]|nr:T9SS type A sorting domain-containing protein [Candidatus Krumholzibacteria bacterium]